MEMPLLAEERSNRLDFIRRKTGTDPNHIRQLATSLANNEEQLSIFAPGTFTAKNLIYDEDDGGTVEKSIVSSCVKQRVTRLDDNLFLGGLRFVERAALFPEAIVGRGSKPFSTNSRALPCVFLDRYYPKQSR
jgi:hypothetical protein